MSKIRKTLLVSLLSIIAIGIVLLCATRNSEKAPIQTPPKTEKHTVEGNSSNPDSEYISPATERTTFSQHKMTALVLSFSEEVIELVQQRELSGFAKTQRKIQKTGNIYYRILDSANQVIWEATSKDPRSLHYDYVNDDGQLDGGNAQLPSADFILRIPELPQAAKLEVFDYTNNEPTGPAFTMGL